MEKFEYATAQVVIDIPNKTVTVIISGAITINEVVEKPETATETACDIEASARQTIRLARATPIDYLLPFFSKLGREGWEVIESKTSTLGSLYGHALLKRRITKE